MTGKTGGPPAYARAAVRASAGERPEAAAGGGLYTSGRSFPGIDPRGHPDLGRVEDARARSDRGRNRRGRNQEAASRSSVPSKYPSRLRTLLCCNRIPRGAERPVLRLRGLPRPVARLRGSRLGNQRFRRRADPAQALRRRCVDADRRPAHPRLTGTQRIGRHNEPRARPSWLLPCECRCPVTNRLPWSSSAGIAKQTWAASSGTRPCRFRLSYLCAINNRKVFPSLRRNEPIPISIRSDTRPRSVLVQRRSLLPQTPKPN